MWSSIYVKTRMRKNVERAEEHRKRNEGLYSIAKTFKLQVGIIILEDTKHLKLLKFDSCALMMYITFPALNCCSVHYKPVYSSSIDCTICQTCSIHSLMSVCYENKALDVIATWCKFWCKRCTHPVRCSGTHSVPAPCTQNGGTHSLLKRILGPPRILLVSPFTSYTRKQTGNIWTFPKDSAFQGGAPYMTE